MRPKQITKPYGMRLLREMASQGKHIFTIEEATALARSQRIPKNQLTKILSSLTKHGWLLRLRRGLYAGTGSPPYQIHLHPFAIATHLVQPSAISHWSALEHHGLTEQIPQMITVSTPNKIITPSMRKKHRNRSTHKHAWEIESICYKYITMKQKHFFGIEKIWIDERFQIPITDKERTLLDVFIHSKMFGGIGEALGILENNLSHIDIKKLIHYVLKYENKSVIKRLGWALEYFGVNFKHFSPLLNIPTKSYTLLEPTGPRKGSYDTRWMIRNNLVKKNNHETITSKNKN